MNNSGICVRHTQKIPLKAYQQYGMRYAFASDFVKEKRVLDIGCWTGDGSRYLSDCGAKEVTGIDISRFWIRHAKKYYGRLTLGFIYCDATKLPFRDNTFDLATSFEVIEHIKDFQTFLSEAQNMLKPGGTFILSTPNKDFSTPYTGKPLLPYHFKEFRQSELYSVLKNHSANFDFYGQFISQKSTILNFFIVAIKSIWSKIPSNDILEKYLENFWKLLRRSTDISIYTKGKSADVISKREYEVTKRGGISRIPMVVIVECRKPFPRGK